MYTADKNHLALANLYGSSNTTAANLHTAAAASLKAGILDLLWDSQKVCLLLIIFEFNYSLISVHIVSLRFMILFSIPTIVVMYFPPPHFILSGVVLSPTKLRMTNNLHLVLSHLSIW